jgi:hypothetical protein
MISSQIGSRQAIAEAFDLSHLGARADSLLEHPHRQQ